MQSETSSSKQRRPDPWFNACLLRKNLTRFWPIWALYAVIWFLTMVAPLLMELRYEHSASTLAYLTQSAPLTALPGMGLITALLFGLIAAMAVFSYLYQARSAALMHTLPIRREGLFLTNYLSGLAFLVGPNVLIFFLTLAAQAGLGRVCFSALFTWLVVQSLLCLFFYSFAVFCAMFTGHILALPVFYGILNGLVVAVVWLVNALMQEYLFGYVSTDSLFEFALWLTPVGKLFTAVEVEQIAGVWVLHGLGTIFLYALVGLGLAALALLVYRRRHLEGAGDVVCVGWVRPIFKYGVAFCAALALGMFLYVIFGWSSNGIWLLFVFMVISGAVGYFVAEMLLRKSFRVFRKSWRGWAFFSLALLILACGLEFDLFGFERRVPSPSGVKEVYLDWVRSAPYDDGSSELVITDPDEIARFTALHAAIVANKDAIERRDYGYASEVRALPVDTAATAEVETATSTSLRLTYTMNGGTLVRRDYGFIPVTEQALSDPASPAALLSDLINDPAVVERLYFSNWRPEHRLVSAALEVVDNTSLGNTRTVSVSLDQTEGDALVRAIRDDIAAGRYHRYLLQNEERLLNCSRTDLTLTFFAPAQDGRESYTYTITITPQATASGTLAALADLGLPGAGGRLVNQAGTPLAG